MNYNDILNKKRERLSKHTGRKLRKKTKAYEKAVARFSRPETIPAAPLAKPAAKPVVVETGMPEYVVKLPDGRAFGVNAKNEKDARAAARGILGAKSLPAGTEVRKSEKS